MSRIFLSSSILALIFTVCTASASSAQIIGLDPACDPERVTATEAIAANCPVIIVPSGHPAPGPDTLPSEARNNVFVGSNNPDPQEAPQAHGILVRGSADDEQMPLVFDDLQNALANSSEGDVFELARASIPEPVPAPPPVSERTGVDGWRGRLYIAPRFHALFLRNQEYHTGTPAHPVHTEYDTNLASSLAVGHEKKTGWGNVRTELEVGYQRSDVTTHEVNQKHLDNSQGTASVAYGFANIYVDAYVNDYLKITGGGGVGIGKVALDDYRGGGRSIFDDNSDYAVGYHLDIGFGVDINEHITLETLYRYTRFNGIEVNTGGTTREEIALDSHGLISGMRIRI